MLTEHDQDLLPRCRRLGHEVTFGYCRQESCGRPCRLIFDCWWEHFDVRAFLRAQLPERAMAEIENMASAAPPAKMLSLLELVEQARARLASSKTDLGDPPAPNLPR